MPPSSTDALGRLGFTPRPQRTCPGSVANFLFQSSGYLQDGSGCKLKPIRSRQSRYLNDRIEQDHRAIKRRVRPMLGFKSADSARVILNGIALT
jgi:transposase-like protein